MTTWRRWLYRFLRIALPTDPAAGLPPRTGDKNNLEALRLEQEDLRAQFALRLQTIKRANMRRTARLSEGLE